MDFLSFCSLFVVVVIHYRLMGRHDSGINCSRAQKRREMSN
jgi:hypothetical protein